MGASRGKPRARRGRDWFGLCWADRSVRQIAMQFAPGDAHCAAQQFVDHVQRNRAAERFILSNAPLLDVDYGASRYVPWSAIDNHRLPSCVYVTPVSVRWW